MHWGRNDFLERKCSLERTLLRTKQGGEEMMCTGRKAGRQVDSHGGL